MAKKDIFANVSRHILDIDSLVHVLDACKECSVEWNLIGLYLGLRQPQLDRISAVTVNPKERLLKVLDAWLRKDTIPGSADPSYYTLCHAVANGGENPALAERIAAEHLAITDSAPLVNEMRLCQLYSVVQLIAKELALSWREHLHEVSIQKGFCVINCTAPLVIFPLSNEHSQLLKAIAVFVDEYQTLRIESLCCSDEISRREICDSQITFANTSPENDNTDQKMFFNAIKKFLSQEVEQFEIICKAPQLVIFPLSDRQSQTPEAVMMLAEECQPLLLHHLCAPLEEDLPANPDTESEQDMFLDEKESFSPNKIEYGQDTSMFYEENSIGTEQLESYIGESDDTNDIKEQVAEEGLEIQKLKRNIGDESEGVAMMTFKRVLCEIGESTKSQDIRLLIVGKYGAGKSTFINSILEMGRPIAEEGAGTNTVKSYFYSDVIPGVNVTLIDTPGLHNIDQRDQSYIQLMKNACQEVSSVLYCTKMTNRHLKDDDKLAMQKLHQAFGQKFWERVVFVLTFANREDCEQRDDQNEQDDEEPALGEFELIKRRFIGRVQCYMARVQRLLKEEFHVNLSVINKINFVPAGNYEITCVCHTPLQLPDRENWLYELLKLICHQIITVHKFKKLNLDDRILLAIVIDNDSTVTFDENSRITSINDQATRIKEALENLGFCVLYFNSLSSESIACLLESLQHVDHSELASFALVVLSKGRTHHVYDVNNEQVSFKDLFHPFFASEKALAKIPKLFFFHLSHFEVPEDRLVFNVRLPRNSIALAVSVCPTNTAAITAFIDGLSSTDNNSVPLKKWLEDVNAAVQSQRRCESSELVSTLPNNYVLPTSYKSSNGRLKMIAIKKKLQLHRTMWHHVRCKTLDVLQDAKDEVLTIVRAERIAKIAASSASVVVGGGLVVIGLILIPFTFGGSIGLSVAGGVVGAAAGATGIGSLITAKVMADRKLKKAQQHISLDQQLSKSVNEVAAELQGVVETSAIGVRPAGCAAEMALAGATLAVTVPLDIGTIAYLLHHSSKNKSGKSDSDAVVKWFVQQTEEMLKGTSTVLYVKEYKIEENYLDTYNPEGAEYGFKVDLLVPSQLSEKFTLAVRTILSGPFVLPVGATLVSAVYDVLMERKLQVPVTIEIEHCVDISMNDQPKAVDKMTFATATVDFDKKVFVFAPLKGGTFPQDQTHGSISLSDSSLLCILYYSESLQDQLMVKYAAQCSNTREFRNYSRMNITFTKCLSAHYKYIQMESFATSVECHPFKFTKPSGLPCINVKMFQTSRRHDGWLVSPDCIPDVIHKHVLDRAELQDISKPHSSEIFPSLTLDIQVEDEERASDELRTNIEVTGTDLQIPIVI